jgi:Protein of unknown function (DUF4232)
VLPSVMSVFLFLAMGVNATASSVGERQLVPRAVPYCRASQMSARATWSPTTQHVAGAVTLVNRSAGACILKGYAALQIVDTTGRVANVRLRRGRASLQGTGGVPLADQRLGLLRPAHRAFFYFEWWSWCDGALWSPATLGIDLPDSRGHIRVLVASPQIGGRIVTPTCQTGSKGRVPSYVVVDPIQLVAAGHVGFP